MSDLAALLFQACKSACKLLLLLSGNICRDDAIHGLVSPLVALPFDFADLAIQHATLLGGGALRCPQLIA
ncbi:hypothetical protein [Mycobacterium palustre]|uniref:Uncharacterized protein n=1 Tax=Mycobacterium palustre TaxID=153971 RepID=A0A1X1YY87_9MYCO|nr:hypothetical protein [Mycobacterium palustre]MCV7101805.1 hypothetical protein [Mycobacterium palustre]ORW16030.1 hypothetical protein AWC19_23045 [Mycobacterium palustre]